MCGLAGRHEVERTEQVLTGLEHELGQTPGGQAEQARIDLTIVKMRTLNQQLQSYSFRHGSFPTTDEGLGALVAGGYVEDAMLADEWGNPFGYYSPTGNPAQPYDLISDGPDGEPSTEDDIDIWYVDQNK